MRVKNKSKSWSKTSVWHVRGQGWGSKALAQGCTNLQNHIHATAIADATTHQRVMQSNVQMNEKKKKKKQQHRNTWNITNMNLPRCKQTPNFRYLFFFRLLFHFFSVFENAKRVWASILNCFRWDYRHVARVTTNNARKKGTDSEGDGE